MTSEFLPKYSRVYNIFLEVAEITILWLVIFAEVFAFNRFIGNEHDVLPFARQFYNRSWLPNDWYLNLDIGYRQLFNFPLGFLIDWFGFLNGAYIGRLLAYLFLAVALFIFFRSISLRFTLGLIVVILFLENQSLIAGEWMVGGADPKTFAYALAILALAFMYKEKYLLGFALAGGALSFHVLIGIYGLICSIAAILLTRSSWKETIQDLLRKSWPVFITGIFGILAIFQQLIPQGEIEQDTAWKIYVEFRVPHHLLPSAWPGGNWYIELILAVFFFLVVYLLSKYGPLKFTAAYALGSASLFLLGLIIFAIGQTSLLRFYWFRYPDVMIPFFSLVILAILLNKSADLKLINYPRIHKYLYWAQPILRYGLPVLFTIVAIYLVLDLRGFIYGKYQRGLNRQPSETQIALEWISENTPEEAVFLVDPLLNEFYIYANRARFISFSHPPQSAAELLEWYGRLTLINGNQAPSIPPSRAEMQENFANLDAELIQQLANEYGVSYYLGQAEISLPFNQVYQDETFSLYLLDPKSQ